jgi:hypothetical protein
VIRLILTLGLALASLLPANPVPAQRPAQQSQDVQSITVYVTRTGKRYHRAGCRSLRHSSTPMELKDAKAKGYTPCGICHPPK